MYHIILTPVAEGPFIAARYADGVFSINGNPVDLPEGKTVIEYGEREKCSTMSDSPAVRIEVIPSTWVDPTPPPAPDPEAEAQAALEAWRQGASADAWQIAFVLGEARWQALVTWADGYFNTRILVAKASVIPRASDTVTLMAWVLEMTEAEVDEVFRQAATIRA